MANELKRVYGTQKTLEASGAACASAAIVAADDATWSTTDTADYPDAIFALTCAFSAAAPTANTTIDLIIHPLNFDGTADGVVPTASYRNHYYGSFLPSTMASQTLYLEVRNLPKEGQAYLYNNATGQEMSLGWVLKMTPLTVAPT